MTLFLIERTFPNGIEITPEIMSAVNEANGTVGVRWLYSLVTVDRRKTFCIYEAQSDELIRRAGQLAGMPVDSLAEVTDIDPHIAAAVKFFAHLSGRRILKVSSVWTGIMLICLIGKSQRSGPQNHLQSFCSDNRLSHLLHKKISL